MNWRLLAFFQFIFFLRDFGGKGILWQLPFALALPSP
jgi:hypothetical protein